MVKRPTEFLWKRDNFNSPKPLIQSRIFSSTSTSTCPTTLLTISSSSTRRSTNSISNEVELIKSYEKELHLKIVHELLKDAHFEFIRNKYTKMDSKSLVYDPVLYGQFAEWSIVQQRLFTVFGGNVLYFQDPDYSKKCLELFKTWKDKEEEDRHRQRVLRAHEVDVRAVVTKIELKKKSNKQANVYQKCSSSFQRQDLSSESETYIPTLIQEHSSSHPKTSPSNKHKVEKINIVSEDKINVKQIKVKHAQEMRNMYTRAEKLLTPKGIAFLPREYFTLRQRKQEEINPRSTQSEAAKIRRLSTISPLVLRSFFKQFMKSDSKDLKTFSEISFDKDESHSTGMFED